MKQLFLHAPSSKHHYSHGGELRKLRAGRKMRALSTKDPIHLVLKANRESIRGGFRSYKRYFLILKLVRIYAKRFFIKIEQISIQGDHVHLLIRISKRSLCQSFLRVLSGQIAQQFLKKGLTTGDERKSAVTGTPTERSRRLWKYRPFTRVVKGFRAYRVVKDYISLNEAEALGAITYSKSRLRGLSEGRVLGLRNWFG